MSLVIGTRLSSVDENLTFDINILMNDIAKNFRKLILLEITYCYRKFFDTRENIIEKSER